MRNHDLMKYRALTAITLLSISLASVGCSTAEKKPGATPSGAAVASASTAPSGVSASSAPPPPPPPPASPAAGASPFAVPAESFPLKLGTHYRLHYTDYRNGVKVREFDEDTTLDKQEGDLSQYLVTSQIGDMKKVNRIYIVSRPDGLWYSIEEPPREKGKKTHKVDASTRMLAFPLKPGSSWEMRMPMGSMASRAVVGMERVTVPAGTFNAVRMQEKREGTAGDSWYVPDVGVIKSDLSGPTERYIKEMVLFEAAKK